AILLAIESGQITDTLEAFTAIRVAIANPWHSRTILQGHTGTVWQATWSKDESKVLTASSDGTARIWDTASGKELVKFTGHTNAILKATWNKDESKILTNSADGTVRIWYVHIQDLIGAACHWVSRNMTKNEWDLYMEGPYRPTCLTVPIPGDVIEVIQTESK